MLLADVFKKFIDTCLKFYKIDPCYYFNSPGLSWNAMLKMTSVKLEKILDIEMYFFIEKALRGGISYKTTKFLMSLQNRQNSYGTLTWIICMVGEWVVILLMVDLSG